MDEGEQLEQVEPAHVGVAEPLPDQRRVEDDVGVSAARAMASPRLASRISPPSPHASQMPAWVAWSAGKAKELTASVWGEENEMATIGGGPVEFDLRSISSSGAHELTSLPPPP